MEFSDFSLDERLLPSPAAADDLVDLDAALERLAAQDARKAQVLELSVFGGLTYEEVARLLDISPATVNRELRFAKAWVYDEIQSKRNDTTGMAPKG